MAFKDKLGRLCGFLDIDEDDKRKKFRRRYFILNKPCGLLEWYSDSPSNLSNNAQPCGIIKLDYITKVDEAKKMKLDFLFVINTPFRQYYIQANNQKDAEEWVQILNDASRIIVPPEAINPQPQPTLIDKKSTNSQDNEDVNADTDQSNCTYRTEIVGNVVVKKKMNDHKQKVSSEEPISPPSHSTGSDFSYQLTPEFRPGMSNPSESRDVIKSGWAVKQGHVRKNWKRRFFVLSSLGFAYYKAEQDRDAIRTIPITEILAAKCERGELSRQRDNLFSVVTTDKFYYIQCNRQALSGLYEGVRCQVSPEKGELDDWCKKVLQKKRNDTVSNKTDTPDEMNDWVKAFTDTLSSNHGNSQKKKHQVVTALQNQIRSEISYGRDYNGDRYAMQDNHQQGTDFSSSAVPDFKSKHGASKPSLIQLHNKQSQSIDFPDARSDEVNAVVVIPSDSRASDGNTQKKHRKTHRRAESEVTALSSHALEAVHVPTGKTLSVGVKYNSEDVKARPESVNLSLLSDQPWNVKSSSTAVASKPKSNNAFAISARLNSQIDTRSAIKPSAVKKKKNPGVLFSFNTMLTKKQDRIDREKARFANK